MFNIEYMEDNNNDIVVMKDDDDFGGCERVPDQPVFKNPDLVDTHKIAKQVRIKVWDPRSRVQFSNTCLV